MQTVYDWDAGLVPQGVGFYRRGMAAIAPATSFAAGEVDAVAGEYWLAKLDRVAAATPAGVNALRALIGRMSTGNLVRVPVFDGRQRPWPGGDAAANTMFSDGTDYSDGTGFAERTIDISLSAAAARGAEEIAVTVSNAGAIEGGEYFTLGERLHVIEAVLAVSGAAQTWSIWPRLRRPWPSGSILGLDRPTCLMRLTGANSADMVMEFGAWTFPVLEFVEAFGAGDRSP